VARINSHVSWITSGIELCAISIRGVSGEPLNPLYGNMTVNQLIPANHVLVVEEW